MKLRIELDESEIRQAVLEYLDGRGFKVSSLFMQHFGQGTDADPTQYMASAMVETKPRVKHDDEEGL
jgi:hypothetical protein